MKKQNKCRICGCTDRDCRACIRKTGEPCYWVEDDLCSACAGAPLLSEVLDKLKTGNPITDIIDIEGNIPVKKICLNIEILRSKKEKARHCVYSPGKESYGHRCIGCGTKKMVCLSVHVNIDHSGYGYVTSDIENINSLLKLCDPSLKAKQEPY